MPSWSSGYFDRGDFPKTPSCVLDPIDEMQTNSSIVSSLKDSDLDEKQVFQIYYDFSEK